MKIGIITFHRALNYGAVLQCYALQTVIQKLHVDVEVIDYKNDFLKRFYSPFYIEKLNLKKIAYMLYAFRSKSVRNKTFKLFRSSHLNISKKQYDRHTIKSANTVYDAIIVGSDQVWNLEQTNSDVNYLLNFAEGVKCYSYAASFGIDSIPHKIKKIYRDNLQKYDDISVREASGLGIVNDILGVEAKKHVDPTLLLEQAEWEKIANNGVIRGDDYICVYKINSSRCYEYADELSKKTGLTVVVIKPDRTCLSHFVKYKNASPEDFLSLIRNADYVITDSFHGIVFSTIFQKKFIACLDSRINNKNTRITELLKAYSLEERLISEQSGIGVIEQELKYNEIKQKLDKDKAAAILYLEKICNE